MAHEWQIRRIPLSPQRARDKVLDYCRAAGLVCEECDTSHGRYCLRAAGNPPGRFFLSPSPRLLLEFSIQQDREEGFTEIRFYRDWTRTFKQWYYRQIAMTFAAALLCFPIVALLASRVPPLWTLLSITAPLVAVAWGVSVSTIELKRVDDSLTRIESGFWLAFAQSGARSLLVADDIQQTRQEASLLLLLTVTMFVPFVVFLAEAGLPQASAGMTLFFLLPLLLALGDLMIVQKLPFRSRWSSLRLFMCLSWFGVMSLPYILVLGVGRMPTLGPVSYLRDIVDVALHGHGFAVMFALVGFGLYWVSAGEAARKIQALYASFRSLPSGGLEDLAAPRSLATSHQVIVILFFGVLAAATALSVAGWVARAADPRWLGRFFAYYSLEARHFLSAFVGRGRAGSPSADLAIWLLLAALMSPVPVTLWVWLVRVRRRLFGRCWGTVRQDQGFELLEALTRKGLFAQLKAELGACAVCVRVHRQGLVAFGASLRIDGLRRRSAILTLDPIVWSALRSPEEREALLWHEVGHVRQQKPALWVLGEIVFNVWGQQVESLLTDSFRAELEADQFAAEKMADPVHLVSALEKLEALGWGHWAVVPRQETLLTGLRDAVRITLGFERMSYWHPHFRVRIRELEKLGQQRRAAGGALQVSA